MASPSRRQRSSWVPSPRHVRMVPGDEQQFGAVRRHPGRGVEVVALVQQGHAAVVDVDGGKGVLRLAVAMNLGDSDQSAAGGIEAEVRVAHAGRGVGDRADAAVRGDPMDVLAPVVDEEDAAVGGQVGAAAVFMDAAPDAVGIRRELHNLLSNLLEQGDATPFRGARLQPIGSAAADLRIADADCCLGHEAGRDRRRPGAVSRHNGGRRPWRRSSQAQRSWSRQAPAMNK